MCRTSLSLLLALSAALPAADRYQASEPHMGTLVTITLYADSPEQAQRAFTSAFARIGELDRILSDYNPNSELSRACFLDAPMSTDLRAIVVYAQKLARKTDGAFDITAGPLTRLWREARKQNRLPEHDALREALARTGYQKLRPSADRITCETEGMQLDSGGIAKGYAADQALKSIASEGVTAALVAVSGDIAVSGPPPGKRGWRVQVQDEVLTLVNAAVSTSGDEFQFLEIGGVRYSHVIDPRTGMPVRQRPPISVIANTGMEADSLATAFSVSGSADLRIIDRRR